MKYRLYDYSGNATIKHSEADYAYCPTVEAAADFRQDYANRGYIVGNSSNPIGWYHLDGDEGIWSRFGDGIMRAMFAELQHSCVA